MTVLTASSQLVQSSLLEDEIIAFSLQLEVLNDENGTRKGKHAVDRVPDLEVAYMNYVAEIESHLSFLNDLKLAHSIANAVATDAQAIEEIISKETQSAEDHRVAVHLSNGDNEFEPPPPYVENPEGIDEKDELARRFEYLLVSDLQEAERDDQEGESGPSVPYAQSQATALQKLTDEQFECVSCTEKFRFGKIVTLKCDHRYCGACLKRVIMRGVSEHNLAYLPPRCCQVPFPFGLIVKCLTEKELEDFQNAEEEKGTLEKTYCTNRDCGRFVSPKFIKAGKAVCPRCNARTCSMCENPYHPGDCPADVDLQTTLRLGEEREWQRCYSCRSLVAIEYGCNHIT
jgi:hypothetical protein